MLMNALLLIKVSLRLKKRKHILQNEICKSGIHSLHFMIKCYSNISSQSNIIYIFFSFCRCFLLPDIVKVDVIKLQYQK